MGERVMRSDYGTEVPNSLFQNALIDPKEAIKTAALKWLPFLTIDDVKVQKDGDSYEVTVEYTTPERKHLSTSVSLDLGSIE
jgi:phage baseplate assembly protein W